ncbi:MAG: hypothetical protein EXS36_05110 [Pedosphaera sp.]|nr:hypothetical protein [Pedosphaera sp.]
MTAPLGSLFRRSCRRLRTVCLVGAAWAALVLPASAQAVFEKHTITKIYSSSCSYKQETNTVTSSSTSEHVAFACGGTGSFGGTGAFEGDLTLQFPATIPAIRTLNGGYYQALPVQMSAGISGTWTITNQFGPADRITTEACFNSSDCPGVKTTNGPPIPPAKYSVSATANCLKTNLSFVIVDGIDYILEIESDLDLLYQNQSSASLNSLHVKVLSRYRAPGGPWLFVATNPPPSISSRVHPR